MDKIIVSRDIADFIESYEENVNSHAGWEDHLLIEHTRTWAEGFKGAKEEAMCMKDIRPLKLSEILIYGYEVEKTKEEKVLALYQVLQREIEEKNLPFDKGAAAGVRLTLRKLDIEIEGVTDDH